MTGTEFKVFWAELRQLYPFDFKGDDDMAQWAEELRAADLAPALRALRQHKAGEKDHQLGKRWPMPVPRKIAENAMRYNGIGRLMWTAIHGNGRNMDGD